MRVKANADLLELVSPLGRRIARIASEPENLVADFGCTRGTQMRLVAGSYVTRAIQSFSTWEGHRNSLLAPVYSYTLLQSKNMSAPNLAGHWWLSRVPT
jgi:hypothetical protein